MTSPYDHPRHHVALADLAARPHDAKKLAANSIGETRKALDTFATFALSIIMHSKS